MRPIALLTAAATVLVASPAFARDFVVSEDKHTVNDASFTSRAAIVRMIGRTNKLTGNANIQLTDMAKSAGTVNVDLLSLDTGISLRNEHMRNFLETSKYPQAVYKFTSIKLDGNKLEPGKLVTGTATGTITIHGVTKPLQAPIELTYLPQQDAKYRPGDWVHFYSQFKIKVADFGIQIPGPMIGQKLANDLTIEIDGMAKGK
jgi:polyisoprenoid-binding protein YceI